METTKVSTDGCIDKEDLVYMYVHAYIYIYAMEN